LLFPEREFNEEAAIGLGLRSKSLQQGERSLEPHLFPCDQIREHERRGPRFTSKAVHEHTAAIQKRA
jgi:hypothetical protein